MDRHPRVAVLVTDVIVRVPGLGATLACLHGALAAIHRADATALTHPARLLTPPVRKVLLWHHEKARTPDLGLHRHARNRCPAKVHDIQRHCRLCPHHEARRWTGLCAQNTLFRLTLTRRVARFAAGQVVSAETPRLLSSGRAAGCPFRGGANVHLPEGLIALLRQPSPCFLATVMPDGSPQVTQTRAGTDGEHVVINSVQGHQKVKNVERDPRVAVSVFDVSGPPRYYAILYAACDVVSAEAACEILHKALPRKRHRLGCRRYNASGSGLAMTSARCRYE